jgi:hypothetical protein
MYFLINVSHLEIPTKNQNNTVYKRNTVGIR